MELWDGTTAMATQVGSQAVDRASALLTLVVESGAPRTFTSLVDELGLAKSTTSRLLQALERSRLVRSVRARCSRCTPLDPAHCTIWRSFPAPPASDSAS